MLSKSLLYHWFNFLYLPFTFSTEAIEVKPTNNPNNTYKCLFANLLLLEKEKDSGYFQHLNSSLS